MRFAKYEGLGNDFVIVEQAAWPAHFGADEAAQICDRHRGVGADGVLVVGERDARPSMKVMNADGSIPEMCGNGIRCVALYLARSGRAPIETRFEIDTDAGPHPCRILRMGTGTSTTGMVEVSMRAPSLRPDDVPVIADAEVIDFPLALDDQPVPITAVSIGNPHAVTFAELGERRLRIGPALQKHPSFPNSVNVGFARIAAPQLIELAVLERGSGWTEACGTGACAAAVAAVATGRAKRHETIEVRLPGGALSIVVGGDGERLSMTGPARHVFDGEIEF